MLVGIFTVALGCHTHSFWQWHPTASCDKAEVFFLLSFDSSYMEGVRLKVGGYGRNCLLKPISWAQWCRMVCICRLRQGYSKFEGSLGYINRPSLKATTWLRNSTQQGAGKTAQCSGLHIYSFWQWHPTARCDKADKVRRRVEGDGHLSPSWKNIWNHFVNIVSELWSTFQNLPVF